MIGNALQTTFVGRRAPVFGMALRMGVLTILTLGIYRFWMKTRLRRYYWSSIRPGGHPLEYVGDPLEKLLGFFIAVVILAFYIGIVNLILMFISFSLFDGNYAAYVASFVGVIPIWFYARYRARRYVLARTRWRGLRFGVDPGAWGYAWRAMVHWAVTILTLGLLWPRMTFWLEKYRIDRTWYGDRQFRQGGSWGMLVTGLIPFWLSGLILIFFLASAYMGWASSEEALGLAFLAFPFMAVASAYYSVRSFRILTAHKSAGDIRFVSRARTPRVVGIYTLGYGLTALITGVFGAIATFTWIAVLFWGEGAAVSLDDLDNLSRPSGAVQAIGFVIYFLVFVIWTALRHIFVTLPLWRHYAETLEIHDTASLHTIRQRARDEHREAEGFAEALDLGAAI